MMVCERLEIDMAKEALTLRTRVIVKKRSRTVFRLWLSTLFLRIGCWINPGDTTFELED